MSENERSVSGYVYENDDDFEDAKKELEAVNYIKEQIDMEQPQMVLHAFMQILHQNLFHTQVGYTFLREMQNFLYSVPEISRESIPDIPVQQSILMSSENKGKENKKDKKDKEKKAKKRTSHKTNVTEGRYKKYFQTMLIICAIMAVMIVGMFAVTLTSNNITILNYKEKIVDEYASWEEELNQKEAEIKEREDAVTEQENKQKMSQDNIQDTN